jgi:2-polyprenyl-6-hydroxyphenyl methylase/3-demethylubiquinone-9 3-methyltransferase
VLRKDVKRASGPRTGSADPAELARFEALADEWWKPDGAFKVMHAFNAERVRHLSHRLPILLGRDPHASRPLAGLQILDVGCAAGLVTEPIATLGADVLGIDAVERNVAVAARHAHRTGAPVRYRHALPEEIADEGQSFDAVLSLEVVEHVADLETFLSVVARPVRRGGILVIGTINRTVASYVKAILGAERILRWLPRGTHQWRKFVTPGELELALSRHSFSVEERCGISLNPLTMRWRISADLSATYLQFHRRP